MSKEYPCVYFDNEKCLKNSEDDHTEWCVFGPCTDETPSYGDCIRRMSDEELAEWIHNGISSDACDYCEYNNGYCDGSPCHGKAEAEIICARLKQPAKMELQNIVDLDKQTRDNNSAMQKVIDFLTTGH